MLAIGLALLVAVLGVAPLLMARKIRYAAIMAAISTLVVWGVFYANNPTLVWPMFGLYGFMVLILWVVAVILDWVSEYGDEWRHSTWLPLALIVMFIIRGGSGSSCFNSSEYASLIGDFEEREWTQDVQPASAQHIRLVPAELAGFLADKQLAQAPGAIGSQFKVDKDRAVIQRIKGEFWWIFPLDFQSFSVWSSADVAPGYVMVHADDPNFQPLLKYQEKFAYTPGAYFGKELERHIWANGYANKGLADYLLEIDENDRAWWVVTVYEPTIAWGGEKMTGIVLVDPASGEIKFFSKDEIPEWVDQAVPKNFVAMYAKEWGDLSGGWVNSWWDKLNLTKPEPVEFVYGTDGEPYWVTRFTSTSSGDGAVVGMFYTNTRTGRTVKYHATGATDGAILQVVNSKVEYKKWHGVSPTVYNVYGVMTSVVPILGSSHVFQGVALVNVENQQAVVGDNLTVALRDYQRTLAGSGNQMAPETAHGLVEVAGVVDRFASAVAGGNTTYYIHLLDVPHLFTGGSENLSSPKLPITVVGDKVQISYIPSGEDVVPVMKFENTSVVLEVTANQETVRQAGQAVQAKSATMKDANDVRTEVNSMSDEDVLKLRSNLKHRNEKSSD